MDPATVAIVVASLTAAATIALALYATNTDKRSRKALILAEEANRRETERHHRERAAELKIVDGSYDAYGPQKNRTYRARVRNIGAATARRVRVWIVAGESPEPIGLLAHQFYDADLTIEAGNSLDVELDRGAAMVSDSLRFCLSWSDDLGDWLADGPTGVRCPRMD